MSQLRSSNLSSCNIPKESKQKMEFVPKGYFQHNLLFVKSQWVRDLLDTRSLPHTFPVHPQYSEFDVQAVLKDGKVPKSDEKEWEILAVDRYQRHPFSVVSHLPALSLAEDDDLCFVDVLKYAGHTNFANSWHEAFRRFSNTFVTDKFRTDQDTTNQANYDSTLLECIYRLYNCLVVYTDGNNEPLAPDEHVNSLRNIGQGIACLISPKEIIVLRRHCRFSVHQMLRFSPAILEQNYMKPLFISFQLLQAFQDVHKRGLIVGDVGLSDVYVDDEFYVTLMPKLTANLCSSNSSKANESQVANKGSNTYQTLLDQLKAQLNQVEGEASMDSKCDNFLGKAVHLWITGQLSNFDYILLLNLLSGRTFSNPNHYPVMPWVRDFSSQNGGWRDLTKSKYRLNKGDTQLDLTFESAKASDETASDSAIIADPLTQQKSVIHFPHHVSDVLSEITYYVYKARQTPKSVLCKYVRNRWVPAEYPSSMQRLMEWTPDECIPEFFTNPEIFTSIHEDLSDLELPSWCQTPHDFIQWHRQCLESQRVSDKLHSWIDLTFGYKLSGSSAIRAKNVCLNLVDNHGDLRDGGVIQLFASPHPAKLHSNPYWDPKKAPILSTYFNATDEDSEETDSKPVNDDPCKPIILPKNYDPLALLQETEQLDAFIAKSTQFHLLRKDEASNEISDKSNDMQVLGCLIMELFMSKKYVAIAKEADLETRLQTAKSLLSEPMLPHCIRGILKSLLKVSELDIVNEFDGLPPPSPFQLMVPGMSPIYFPPSFPVFARILRVHQHIQESAIEAQRYRDKWSLEVEEKVADVISKTLASELLPIIDDLSLSELSILLPKLRRLFGDKSTAITMAWLTFEPLARQLGPSLAIEHFLQPIVDIYENNAQTSKHLKLYHRTFLANVLVRFGLHIFLKYFTENLIEAVGGYKDFSETHRQGLERHWNVQDEVTPDIPGPSKSSPAKNSAPSAKTPNEEFTEGEVFAFDNDDELSKSNIGDKEKVQDVSNDIIEVPSAHDVSSKTLLQALVNSEKMGKLTEGNISQVASESVIWLAHRLGPVLTAKYLSKNLLKMLNLCYVTTATSPSPCEVVRQQDFIIRICGINKTQGDILANNVLECLTEIASIFGENFILLQYLPYAWDLIALCKKRLSPNLEGGLIGCVSMVHHMIPYLNDSILMNELAENFMSKLLFPVLQLASSRSVSFSAGGPRQRRILLAKLLDVTYLIGLRIGEEMARTHLTPLTAAFFSAFDKVFDENGNALTSQECKDALEELQQVLTADFAHSCYIAFYHLMGRAHLDCSIPNLRLIKILCHAKSFCETPLLATYSHLRGAQFSHQDSSASSGGNKILSSQDSGSVIDDHSQEIHGLIKKEMRSGSPIRHLRGNWLAYWEHEIGRADTDRLFSLKQIKLQTFQGHSAGIKALDVLDNENSFLSASRDKTVKVWSLRSQGDGTATISPQWSYNVHKKSVTSVYFLDNVNLAVSCDSTIHIWDPFVGTGVHQVDPLRLGPVSVMVPMKKPSTMILAATQQDSMLHMIDCRMGNIVTDLKVSIGSAGLMRCLCTDPDGYTITTGHSSGFISQLDIRTGKLRQAWKAHEGEILTLTTINSKEFVSTSLDQVVSVWYSSEGKIKCMLPGTQEPVHCVSVNEEGKQLMTGSTANRIAIRRGFNADSAFSSSKLKSDILRGNMTSMKFLPMNRLILLGEDTGKIRLIC